MNKEKLINQIQADIDIADKRLKQHNTKALNGLDDSCENWTVGYYQGIKIVSERILVYLEVKR